MSFEIDKSVEILERTPAVLTAMLTGLSEDWIMNNEGPDTWSPYDIVGHLIHGEETDWIPRMKIILSDSPDKRFTPFDRFAQFTNSKGKTLSQLLETFTTLRAQNLETLRSAAPITPADLLKTGIHPAFGPVTLSQLLATWVAHDLNHIAQIARVMAVQYRPDAGPWVAYLKILQG
ncbi:MAG: DinB family protein [Bacteroidota bacterium]|nr:DinB family protein [Bacteroidota bacterium]MDP4245251.1 DinB family protein [Bacteroidota bacterium]MDP4255877.1 DinB family protein [Bacteroidota bacterium]MDP4260293.1 DinB family protein [Bacteroidota bacterium]